MIKNFEFLKDKQFIAAILVAIFVWIVMSLLGFSAPQNFNPIMVILLYPILEEIAFRGVVQDYFCQKFDKNPHQKIWIFSYGNIITSVLFVSMHFMYHPPLWATLVFIPSIIFGYFKDRFKSVIPAIFLHIFYNFGYFYML